MKQAAEAVRRRMAFVSSAVATLAASAGAWVSTAAHAVNDLPGGPAVNQLNFHPPVTKIAEEQHWLHWFMMGICAVIFVIVFGVMFYSILKHRKSVGHQSQALPEPIWVELGWTIVPLLIVIGMALPATKVLVYTIRYGGSSGRGPAGVVTTTGAAVSLGVGGFFARYAAGDNNSGSGSGSAGADRLDRYCGFTTRAMTRTMTSPPTSVRISPFSTSSTHPWYTKT